jgi:hypothetical protein
VVSKPHFYSHTVKCWKSGKVSRYIYEITNIFHVTYEIRNNDNMMLQLLNNERASKLPGIIQGAYTCFLRFTSWAITLAPVKLSIDLITSFWNSPCSFLLRVYTTTSLLVIIHPPSYEADISIFCLQFLMQFINYEN